MPLFPKIMLIGKDFDKISFEWMGLELLEPNAFIGDTLLFTLSLAIWIRLRRIPSKERFFSGWRQFFLLFGISFLFGGFGHLLYNYWGIPGKTPSWYLTLFATYGIEQAMISIHPEERKRLLFTKISQIKLALAIVGVTAVSLFVNLAADYSKGMLVPTINSTVGLIWTLGFLGYQYSLKNKELRVLWISVLILFPAAVIQAVKFNIHPWFDKNDFGHVLLMISLMMYYRGVIAYKRIISA